MVAAAARILAVLSLLGACALAVSQTPPVERGVWPSESGQFELTYASDLEPIEINRIHAWTLYLRSPDGDAVEGAAIEVSGGMPAHDHGLPTRPRITRALGGGAYLLEGLRFHMHGAWQIDLAIITADGQRDRVVIELQL
jgi:hypothetical protein